jgi:hypothetical protein
MEGDGRDLFKKAMPDTETAKPRTWGLQHYTAKFGHTGLCFQYEMTRCYKNTCVLMTSNSDPSQVLSRTHRVAPTELTQETVTTDLTPVGLAPV